MASDAIVPLPDARRRSHPVVVGIGVVLLVATVFYVSLFLFDTFRGIFHSDAAVKSILADLALREGRFIPLGWTYTNGDLLIVTPFLLSLPLTAWLGLGFLPNALATWGTYIAMLGATWWMLRRFEPGRPHVHVVALVLVACGLGAANVEFLISQGAYSAYVAFSMPLFALVLVGEGRRWQLVATALLAFMLALANPVRALVMAFLPVLCAMALAQWVGGMRVPGLVRVLLDRRVFAMFAGALVGAVLYRFALVPIIDNFDAAAHVSLAHWRHMGGVARRLPGDWFTYFTLAAPWRDLTGGMRFLQAIAWAIAAALPVAPFALLRSASLSRRRLGWLCLALLASGFGPLIVFDGLYQGAMEVRYATLGIIACACALAVVLGAAATRRPRLAGTAMVALMLGATMVSMSWRTLQVEGNPDARGVTVRDRTALIEALERHHVGTALATFWHSHVLTVLSEGKLRVQPVGYGERLQPYPHHVPHVPVHGSAGPREAVVLTRSEFQIDEGAAVLRQLGAPSERIEVGPYVAWIYDRDIAAGVFGVGHRIDAPVEPALLGLDTGQGGVVGCLPQAKCVVRLHLRNTGKTTLATAGTRPLRVGLRGLDADGNVVLPDMGRVEFPLPLAPGADTWAQATLPSLPIGVAVVQPCLLQEFVNWMCDRTTPVAGPGALPLPAEQLDIELSRIDVAACSGRDACTARVIVRNSGKATLSSAGALPLRIGVQAIAADGTLIDRDAGRANFPHPLKPGGTDTMDIDVPHTPRADHYRLCLLQEMVAWHCERTHAPAVPARR